MYSNPPDYLSYLYNRITVPFASKNKPFEEFPVVLRRDMSYKEVTRQLGIILNCNPNYILLILPDCYGNPKTAPRQVNHMLLIDLLLLIPQQKNTNHDLDTPRLYFDLLPISLSEYESKKLIKLNFCSSTLNDIQVLEFYLPKLARTSSIYSEMREHKNIRVFQVVDHKLVKILSGSDVIPDDGSNLYAEIIPEEELEMGEGNFYISVYHYQKELRQTHSVPFTFLVIKVKYHRLKV